MSLRLFSMNINYLKFMYLVFYIPEIIIEEHWKDNGKTEAGKIQKHEIPDMIFSIDFQLLFL